MNTDGLCWMKEAQISSGWCGRTEPTPGCPLLHSRARPTHLVGQGRQGTSKEASEIGPNSLGLRGTYLDPEWLLKKHGNNLCHPEFPICGQRHSKGQWDCQHAPYLCSCSLTKWWLYRQGWLHRRRMRDIRVLFLADSASEKDEFNWIGQFKNRSRREDTAGRTQRHLWRRNHEWHCCRHGYQYSSGSKCMCGTYNSC